MKARQLLAVPLIALLLVAGCGSDEGDPSAPDAGYVAAFKTEDPAERELRLQVQAAIDASTGSVKEKGAGRRSARLYSLLGQYSAAQADRLAGVDPPENIAAEHDAYVASLERAGELYAGFSKRFEKLSNPEKLEKALRALLGTLSNEDLEQPLDSLNNAAKAEGLDLGLRDAAGAGPVEP